jgi:hypothetical protein
MDLMLMDSVIWRHLFTLARMMYDEGDPRKFLTDTPKEMWSTMERCWQAEPTSERIVEDVLAFPRVLRVIIYAKGCVVADDQLRSGRRYVAVDERSELKHKPRDSQRKSTILGSQQGCVTLTPREQKYYITT